MQAALMRLRGDAYAAPSFLPFTLTASVPAIPAATGTIPGRPWSESGTLFLHGTVTSQIR